MSNHDLDRQRREQSRLPGHAWGAGYEQVDVRPVLDLMTKAFAPRRAVLMLKSLPTASTVKPKRRKTLLLKSSHMPMGQQELAARLATAVMERRIGDLDAAKAEQLIEAGHPLPADLLAMIQPEGTRHEQ